MRHNKMGRGGRRGRREGFDGAGEGRGRGHGRMRHGDVRAALLLALQDGPGHGYELGQRLERSSAGMWRPSPGSIYPTLQAMADEELVSAEERDGKRIYTLTKKGVTEVKERSERGEGMPWRDAYDGTGMGMLREAVIAIRMAAKQITTVGTPEQHARAKDILVEARRQLYDLLANG
jgi:DNA-binding PadR family transcriptional regulator